MNDQQIRDMVESMRTGKSDAMDFVVTREKKEPGRTISAEALRELQGTIDAFVEARIMHHWDAKPNGTKDVGPSTIRAEVKITIDDFHIEPAPDERPWFIIDGNGRLGRMRPDDIAPQRAIEMSPVGPMDATCSVYGCRQNDGVRIRIGTTEVRLCREHGRALRTMLMETPLPPPRIQP